MSGSSSGYNASIKKYFAFIAVWMKCFHLSHHKIDRLLLNFVYGLIFLSMMWVLIFYIRYAFQAWFFQDDFGFLCGYAHSLELKELLNFANFGRFISRNVYWHLGWKLFGSHAELYYLLNLSLILASSLLVYAIIEGYAGKMGAWVCVFAYLGGYPIIIGYAWLSNSQHLLAHFFFFLYMAIYFAAIKKNFNLFHMVMLTLIYILGLNSNIFAGACIFFPYWFSLFRNELRKNLYHVALLLISTVLFFIYFLKLKAYSTEAYSIELTSKALISNAEFYFHHFYIFLLWSGFCLSVCIIFTVKGRIFEASLSAASLILYLPFSFLAYQRYHQYFALTFTLLLAAVVVLIKFFFSNKVYYQSFGYGLLIAVTMFMSMGPMRYLSAQPWGADQRALVNQLKILSSGKHFQRICFNTTAVAKNPARVAVWKIPPEWWFVGFGNAFTFFVNERVEYVLTNPADSCGCTLIIDKDRLLRKNGCQ